MKLRIYISVIAAVFTISLSAQNNYVWLHGLNGKVDSWYVYQREFTPNNGVRLGYDSNKGISQITANLYTGNKESFKNNTVVVAHSMGGLVSRELERLVPSSVKAIVTVGTPHHGAPAAEKLLSGDANQLVDKAVRKARGSINSSLIALGFTIPGISLSISNISIVTNGLIDLVGIPYVNGLVNSAISNNYSAQCTKDMIPNSAFMKRISNHKTKVPILTIATEEDSWQIARLGYCASNGTKLDLDPKSNEDGNFDKPGYDKMSNVYKTFNAASNVHGAVAAGLGIGGFLNPTLWAASTANLIAAISWSGTTTYVRSGLDYDHAILVGASHVERIEKKHKIWFITWTTVKYVTVTDPHDGVVPVKSQQMDKSYGNRVIWANAVLKGVNHLEQRNHKNTRLEMKKVLDQGGYGDEFKK